MRLMGRHVSPIGTTTEYWWDDVEEKLYINRVDDVAAILENNAKEYSMHSSKATKKFKHEIFNKVASIPLVVAEKWRKEENIDVFKKEDAEKVRRKLNDPEYQFLRTMPGRL